MICNPVIQGRKQPKAAIGTIVPAVRSDLDLAYVGADGVPHTMSTSSKIEISTQVGSLFCALHGAASRVEVSGGVEGASTVDGLTSFVVSGAFSVKQLSGGGGSS